MWANGSRDESLQFLRHFATELQSDIVNHGPRVQNAVVDKRENELPKLLARCFFKIAEWQMALVDDWTSVRDNFPLLINTHVP